MFTLSDFLFSLSGMQVFSFSHSHEVFVCLQRVLRASLVWDVSTLALACHQTVSAVRLMALARAMPDIVATTVIALVLVECGVLAVHRRVTASTGNVIR